MKMDKFLYVSKTILNIRLLKLSKHPTLKYKYIKEICHIYSNFSSDLILSTCSDGYISLIS